jgi:hypothetical protein
MKYLVDEDFLVEKFPGKGGWTFVSIPQISASKNSPFGWVRISGFVDSFELKQYKLMPMGNGKLFLPLKSEIRKSIKKEQGDTVRVKVYIDETPSELTEELLECFANEEPVLLERFNSLPKFEQRAIIQNIYDSKTEKDKSERIVKLMVVLSSKS